MDMKAGSRWKSVVCDTELVVIRAPDSALRVDCGGHEIIPFGDTAPTGLEIDGAESDGTQVGKRYADEELGIELLCTKAGIGSITVEGTRLPLKDAKPLPASD